MGEGLNKKKNSLSLLFFILNIHAILILFVFINESQLRNSCLEMSLILIGIDYLNTPNMNYLISYIVLAFFMNRVILILKG